MMVVLINGIEFIFDLNIYFKFEAMGILERGNNSAMEKWYEKSRRTIKSRDLVLSESDMLSSGILEVINVSSAIDELDPDDGKAMEITMQGRYGREPWTSVLVDSAIKGVKSRKTGETNYIRVYSGIVFKDEFHQHLFALRRRDMYPDMGRFFRLCN